MYVQNYFLAAGGACEVFQYAQSAANFFLPHLPLFFTAIAISFNFAPAAKLAFRTYPNNRVVMRPSENLSAYGGCRAMEGI